MGDDPLLVLNGRCREEEQSVNVAASLGDEVSPNVPLSFALRSAPRHLGP